MARKNVEPEAATATAPEAPSGLDLGQQKAGRRGANPFVVAGAAFAFGTVLAKLLDWRGHAHARR